MQLWLCWPVARPMPAGFAAEGVMARTGTLPARRELVTRWTYGDADDADLEGGTHPAFVALLEATAARGLDCDLATLRQIGIMGDGVPAGLELAVTVS